MASDNSRADNMAEDAVEIARLAALPVLTYERERRAAAEALGISRVSILDRLVGAARGDNSNSSPRGRPLVFDEPEPWPTRLEGASMLDELVRLLHV
jgi:hypothetical protein